MSAAGGRVRSKHADLHVRGLATGRARLPHKVGCCEWDGPTGKLWDWLAGDNCSQAPEALGLHCNLGCYHS